MKCFQHHKMHKDQHCNPDEKEDLVYPLDYWTTVSQMIFNIGLQESDLFDMCAHMKENLSIAESAVLTEMKIHGLQFATDENNPIVVHTSYSRWSGVDTDGEETAVTVWFTFLDDHISTENYDVEDAINDMIRASPLIQRLEKRFGGKIEVFASYPIDRLFNKCEDCETNSSQN